MKIVKVPADINATGIGVNGKEEKIFSFKEALTFHLDNYGEIKTISMTRQSQKVIDAIEAGNGTIVLEDADYDLLKAACSKVVYIPRVTRQLFAFYDAVDHPEEVKKP